MQLTYEELFAQNQALIRQLNEALLEIRELRAEVQDLKDKLNTNSFNSSKPPSQDPFRQRGKSNKTSGRN